MATKSNPTYIRAYLCRAQAYRCIHDVNLLILFVIIIVIGLRLFKAYKIDLKI